LTEIEAARKRAKTETLSAQNNNNSNHLGQSDTESNEQTEIVEFTNEDWSLDWSEVEQPNAFDLLLPFKSGAGDYLPTVYGTGSRRTYFRQQQHKRELEMAAKRSGQTTITSFLTGPVQVSSSVPAPEPPVILYIKGFEPAQIQAVFERLKGILSSRTAKTQMSNFEVLRLAAVQRFFINIMEGDGKMAASEDAARIFGKSGPSASRMVRAWSKIFYDGQEFPPSRKGAHQKTVSLIDDEDVRADCLEYLRGLSESEVSPKSLLKFVNEELLPKYTGSPHSSICLRTAQNWLYVLNFRFQERKKGVYVDGHEREDVVEYRREFLQRMAGWLPFMATYEENASGHMEEHLPNLQPGAKRHVFVVHDESIFTSYDSNRLRMEKTLFARKAMENL